MELFYREVGGGCPVVVLHGLYGSSDNWVGVAKRLGEHYRVILVDQRNHGRSPHGQTHTYGDLANDLYGLVRRLGLGQFHLVGHSMGGRAAMLFQSLHPTLVKSLVAVDVAPWGYSGAADICREHRQIIGAMTGLPVGSLASRAEADGLLSAVLPSDRLRQFLLKNLRRTPQGRLCWSLNLPVLASSLEAIMQGGDVDRRAAASLNVLFVKGGNSGYIAPGREAEILAVYPRATLVTIDNAGHWLHAEQPEAFVGEVLRFLRSV